jgi:hypothetical protein
MLARLPIEIKVSASLPHICAYTCTYNFSSFSIPHHFKSTGDLVRAVGGALKGYCKAEKHTQRTAQKSKKRLPFKWCEVRISFHTDRGKKELLK